MFKPSSVFFFSDRSKVVLLLWILFVTCVSRLSLLYCLVFSLHPCHHLLGKADLLALMCVMFPCAFVTFHYGVSGQVWKLIVSISDLCPFFTFIWSLFSADITWKTGKYMYM